MQIISVAPHNSKVATSISITILQIDAKKFSFKYTVT